METIKVLYTVFIGMFRFFSNASKERTDIFTKSCLPMIKELKEKLMLETWDDFVVGATSQHNISDDFFRIYGEIRKGGYMNGIVWTSRNKNIKKYIRSITEAFEVFIDIYTEHYDPDLAKRDIIELKKYYKDNNYCNENYNEDLEKYRKICEYSTKALNNCSYALNRLVDYIQENFPDAETDVRLKKYFLIDGKEGILSKEMLPKKYWKNKKKLKKQQISKDYARPDPPFV